tara:strand:- start:860 stop:1600 length:741 start_codon:yes stop_codon:yes gene_type:complete
MKELTPEQIQHNWGNLRQLIDAEFTGERLEKLNEMYDYFEERMMFAPASGKEHYHNAHAGGYVEHVIHVTTSAIQIKQLWEKNGATINFTDEELVMAALHHDLGKIGDLAEDYYTPNDSDWHRKNQGLVYKHNGNLQYMTVTDRALFLLQHFGITISENEYIGLMLTDGLYEEANKSYYIGYSADRSLKTNIAYILHQADMMATHIEFDQWKRGDHAKKVVKQEEVKQKTQQSDAANKAFKELFGE